MNRQVVSILALVVALVPFPNMATAEASGPDFLKVIDVSADDTLNMRTGPSAAHPKVAELPHDADGIANLGCVGGLTFEEWSNASQKEREAARFDRWCLVGHERVVGWSSGRYLVEGTHTDHFRAGQLLRDLQGSEWRATRIGEQLVDGDLVVRFGSDGEIWGDGGCNQFKGTYETDRDAVSFGQIATTRKFCGDDLMKTEAEFLDVLQKAARASAYHLVMVLLAEDHEILAQFARTDWD